MAGDEGDGPSGLIRFPTSANMPSPGMGDGADDALLHYSEPPSPVLEERMMRRAGADRSEPWPKRAAAAWRRLVHGPPRQPRYRSGYLTLIPLSDARLQPRRIRLTVALSLLLALLIAAGVYVAVPRGVTVGTLDMHSIKMHFNGTTMNYRILLGAKVPVINPNYFKSQISGNLSISFYDAGAGWQDFGPIEVPPRSFPAAVHVRVDASNLPGKYTAVVIGCCLNFPRRLIFFLTASFRARYMLWDYALPLVDSYFMLDCSDANGGANGGANDSSSSSSSSSGGGGFVDGLLLGDESSSSSSGGGGGGGGVLPGAAGVVGGGGRWRLQALPGPPPLDVLGEPAAASARRRRS